MPHWGTQYTHRVDPIQRRVGRRLVDAGADLVVGGHPHWVQGLERYHGAVIAYSLGNFVFDMDFMTQTMEGIALTATFRGDRLRRVDLTPYRLDSRFAPHVLHGAEARAVLAQAH
jgi:poly-gamma-glutamate synthesis protein (capsule biosynthesis protein)